MPTGAQHGDRAVRTCFPTQHAVDKHFNARACQAHCGAFAGDRAHAQLAARSRGKHRAVCPEAIGDCEALRIDKFDDGRGAGASRQDTAAEWDVDPRVALAIDGACVIDGHAWRGNLTHNQLQRGGDRLSTSVGKRDDRVKRVSHTVIDHGAVSEREQPVQALCGPGPVDGKQDQGKQHQHAAASFQ